MRHADVQRRRSLSPRGLRRDTGITCPSPRRGARHRLRAKKIPHRSRRNSLRSPGRPLLQRYRRARFFFFFLGRKVCAVTLSFQFHGARTCAAGAFIRPARRHLFSDIPPSWLTRPSVRRHASNSRQPDLSPGATASWTGISRTRAPPLGPEDGAMTSRRPVAAAQLHVRVNRLQRRAARARGLPSGSPLFTLCLCQGDPN